MAESNSKFADKVQELAAVCRHLDIPRILVVRRMTLNDPESLKWATQEQLSVVFDMILTEIISTKSYEGLELVAQYKYEDWLPPSQATREEDRQYLSKLCGPLLPPPKESPTATVSFAQAEAPPLMTAEEILGSEEIEEDYKPFKGFNHLLNDTILSVLKGNLRIMAVTKSVRSFMPLSFFHAPQFALCFLPVVTELILPALHGSRSMKELATSRDWSKPGEDQRLLGILQGGESRHNTILHQWDTRWDHFSEQSQSALRAKNKADPDDKLPWTRFMADAGKNDYIAAGVQHLDYIKGMLRWEPETLAEGWEQLNQMYAQEFNPPNKHDQARPGSFRDGIAKWIEKIPRHGGEALAMKAFYVLPKCDKVFMHKLTQTFGMASQRQAAIPLLIELLESLPK